MEWITVYLVRHCKSISSRWKVAYFFDLKSAETYYGELNGKNFIVQLYECTGKSGRIKNTKCIHSN